MLKLRTPRADFSVGEYEPAWIFLWVDYRTAIGDITNDDSFPAVKLMELDWHESTGDANDASLVPHLAIIQ